MNSQKKNPAWSSLRSEKNRVTFCLPGSKDLKKNIDVPRKLSYSNSKLKYIFNFMQSGSIFYRPTLINVILKNKGKIFVVSICGSVLYICTKKWSFVLKFFKKVHQKLKNKFNS